MISTSLGTEERLSRELDGWVAAYKEEYTFMRKYYPKISVPRLRILSALPICNYRSNTTQMYVILSFYHRRLTYVCRITAYLRLVVLAAAFQHALKRGLSRQCDVFKRALDAAKMVISIMVERLYPTGHLRFAMEANFLYVAYAAAFLTNVRGYRWFASLRLFTIFSFSCCDPNSSLSLMRDSSVRSYSS